MSTSRSSNFRTYHTGAPSSRSTSASSSARGSSAYGSSAYGNSASSGAPASSVYGPSSISGVGTGGSMSVYPGSSVHGWMFNSPHTPTVNGLPVTTMVATGISLVLNLVMLLLILLLDCPLNVNQVSHFVAFLVTAEVALALMLYVNFYSHHYHYNCFSLTLSFIYSGSAALLIYGMVLMLFNGFCAPQGTRTGSIITAGVIINYVLFIMASFSVSSQLIAHYYYG